MSQQPYQIAGYGPGDETQGLILPRATGRPGGLVAAMVIWVPVLLIAFALYLAGAYRLTALAVGLGMMLHSLLRPYVSVCMLIIIIPLDWMIDVSDIMSASKLVAVWAVIMSLPVILRAVTNRRPDPLVKWLVPFVALPVLLAPASHNPVWALAWTPTLFLIYSLPLLLSVHFKDRRGIQLMVFCVLFAGLLNVWFTIQGGVDVLLSKGDTRVDYVSEVGGAGGDNEAARAMCVCALGCIFLFMTNRNLLLRVASVALGVLFVVAVVLTKARACYIALPASLAVSLLFLKGGGLSRRIILLVVLMFGGALVWFVGDQIGLWGVGITKRFSSIFEEGTKAGNRITFWTGYVKAFFASGMIGNGFRMTGVSPGFIQYVGHHMSAHNDLIQILGDMGLLGVILFLGMFVHLFRRIRRMELVWHKAFALSILAFILLAGLTESDFWLKYYGLSLAMAVVLIRYDESVREQAAMDMAYLEQAE